MYSLSACLKTFTGYLNVTTVFTVKFTRLQSKLLTHRIQIAKACHNQEGGGGGLGQSVCNDFYCDYSCRILLFLLYLLFLQHFHCVFGLSQLYLVKIAQVKTQPTASISEVLFRGLRSTSLVWISEPVISCIEGEAMSLSVFYYCICAFLSHCYSFNPSLCHLLPFLLSAMSLLEILP